MVDLEGIDIDGDPDVPSAVLDEQHGLVAVDDIVVARGRLEQRCEPIMPVLDGDVRAVDESGDLAVGLAGEVQERPVDAPFDGGALAANICWWRPCSTMWPSIAEHQTTSSVTPFALILTPLLVRSSRSFERVIAGFAMDALP